MRLPPHALKWSLGLLFIAIFAMALQLIPAQVYSLEYVQSQYQPLKNYYQAHPQLSALLYFALYIMVTALSLPLATVMTVVGGAIFGFFLTSVLVVCAASIGASIAFLSARFILRESLEQRFAIQLEKINQGVAREGLWYLFSLRLLPIVPFFIVNLLFGLTHMPMRHFFGISLVGMLPATLVYVNAGAQLGQLQSLQDIMSLPLFLSLALLAVLPWVLRLVLRWLKPQSH